MGVLFRVSELYQEMWKAIIRPPRDTYRTNELGPSVFAYHGRHFKRRDFELLNSRGFKIQCSHFEPVDRTGEYPSQPYPCVIYLHGNCSSRLEALNCGCLHALLPQGISVLCFDFSGCGLSEGDYVTLGWYEREDLELVVSHLRELFRISTIGLWGRSMGAVTACMFADSDPTIAGIVVDSPFASLRKLAEELAADFVGWRIPRLLLNPALNMVRNTIQSRAKFDLDGLQPIEHCRRSYAPALFIAAKDDCFIRPHHCREMHDVYPGDKNFILVEGNHNSPRPTFLQDSISIFFRFALQAPVDLKVGQAEPAGVWEDVAASLAASERLRRERLTQAVDEAQGRSRTSSPERRRHRRRARGRDDQTPSRATTADAAAVVVDSPVSTENDEDDPALTTAIAQMVILESIQGIARHRRDTTTAVAPAPPCDIDLSRLPDGELEQLIQGVVQTEGDKIGGPPGGFHMLSAPHRVVPAAPFPVEYPLSDASSGTQRSWLPNAPSRRSDPPPPTVADTNRRGA